jgi:Ca-activated chloride channel homolog
MKSGRIIALFLFLCIANSGSAQELTRILFIFDASNSMNAKWGSSQTRFEAAKEVLIKSVDSIKGSENLEIALRVYGHQSPITTTYQDCNDTKLEVPFAKDNYEAVKNRIKTLAAKGTTPIARSLEAAAGDFPDTKARNVIILITDGLEACDNDPCVIAAKLHEKGVTITPFVIGLGLDLSYLDQFKCIGHYSEAETKDAFKRVIKDVLGKAMVNTTVQINLNDLYKKPSETDVTVLCYKAGTRELKYTFEHTINKWGNPDTLVMDPNMSYDLVVNTIPMVELKNVVLKKNVHNTIQIDCPQGEIRVYFSNATINYNIDVRVMKSKESKTLNTQEMGEKDRYIVGSYDLEILTLPRIYKTVNVTQDGIAQIDILAPGKFTFSGSKQIAGQIFLIKENGEYEWVSNLDSNSNSGSLLLQPGDYALIYRQKHLKSTSFTTTRVFKIYSNKTTPINI